MEKDQLKEATAGRSRRGSSTAAAIRATKVSDAIGMRKPLALTWPDGTSAEFTLCGLDVNDLVEMETEYGSADGFLTAVTEGKLSAMRFLFWLVLRKGDPRLTAEDRMELRYGLTLAQAGALIAANPATLQTLTQQILAGSGLAQQEGAPGNAETPTPE